MSAAEEIQEILNESESVEGIVFGPFGWSMPEDVRDHVKGYKEPDPPPVPFDKRGIVLSFDEAKPYMQDWSFCGGFGAPKCYSVYIWTTDRVFWVTQYDGATSLCCAPRHPIDCMPDMPGG